MNAIKTKDQQNHTALKFFSSSATVNSRRRHTYVGATVGTTEMDGNSWKQNAAQSQVVDLNCRVLISNRYFIVEKNSRTFNSTDVRMWKTSGSLTITIESKCKCKSIRKD